MPDGGAGTASTGCADRPLTQLEMFHWVGKMEGSGCS